jgi:NADPH-dependent curcumin reductase CurA
MPQASVVVLRRRPHGPAQLEDFGMDTISMPEPAEGEVLVAARYITVDPYVRALLDDPSVLASPVPLGGVPPGDMLAEIVRSRVPDLPEGVLVVGRLGWRSHAIARPAALRRAGVHGLPAQAELSLLSTAGLTAWFGVTEVLRLRPGDTVVVSSASGGVGNIAAQLARISGARVIGIAGGERKRAFIETTLGLAGAIDYRATPDVGIEIDRLCPDGIDAYFDNVGGSLTDAIFRRLAVGARVAVCGSISQYNSLASDYRSSVLGPIEDQRATVTGLYVGDFAHRYDWARMRLAALARSGMVVPTEDVLEGFAMIPAAFVGMMAGDNIGKRLVKI